MLEFGQRYLEDRYDVLLRALLSVAAITVPLLIAFLAQRFFLLRQHQLTRATELGHLQDQLKLYRQALYGLSLDLLTSARRNSIEPNFKRSFREQQRDLAFWERESASVEFYILCFHEFGVDHWYQPEYAHTGRLMESTVFDYLYRTLEECSAMFVRPKYYGPVLKLLNIREAHPSGATALCTDRVHWDVPHSLVSDGDDVRTMGFWERIAEDALELMQRMSPIYDVLLSRIPVRSLLYAALLTASGILLPLALLAIDFPEVGAFYATYTGVLLFAGSLSAALADLWRHLRSPWLA